MTIHDSIKNTVPSTSGRVPLHTAQKVNNKIREETLRRLHNIGGDSKKIDARLKNLELEWDIERAIEANAATIALTGVILGATLNKRWLILPGIVAGFLLQHAVQGWCPPVPILRRLGFRTQREIDNERIILKARRGDLEKMNRLSADQALKALN